MPRKKTHTKKKKIMTVKVVKGKSHVGGRLNTGRNLRTETMLAPHLLLILPPDTGGFPGQTSVSSTFYINYPGYYRGADGNVNKLTPPYIYTRYSALFDEYRVKSVTMQWIPNTLSQYSKNSSITGLVAKSPILFMAVDQDDDALISYNTPQQMLGVCKIHSVFKNATLTYVNKTLPKTAWINCATNPNQIVGTDQNTINQPLSKGTLKCALPPIASFSNQSNNNMDNCTSAGHFVVTWKVEFRGYNTIAPAPAEVYGDLGVTGSQGSFNFTGDQGIMPGTSKPFVP